MRAALKSAPCADLASDRKRSTCSMITDVVFQLLLQIKLIDIICEQRQLHKRDDHVLVELEGVGVSRDRAQVLAILPEELALLFVGGGYSLGVVGLDEPYNALAGALQELLVVALDIDQQHRLRNGRPVRLVPVIDGETYFRRNARARSETTASFRRCS